MGQRRRGVAILALLLVSSCAGEDDKARARVQLMKDPLLTASMFHVAMSDGRSDWQFEPEDLRADRGGAGAWSAPEVRTRTSGALVIQFGFRDTLEQAVSEGEVVIPLRRDWRWSIDVFRASEDPILRCFGCVGSESFPIRDPAYTASDSDSVFVVWGGNYLSNPVIY